MIAFPVFERLQVQGYEMYPGTSRSPGLDITFKSGTTLILGANGLGKTTLITMLYRLCAGLSELRNSEAAALGTRSRSRVRIQNRAERRLFAARVFDDATDATATLDLRVRDCRVSVTRSLQSLEILHLEVDGEELETTESRYQGVIVSAADLADYADWILLLRYVTFYFEERRALVWDPSAQRQLLRLLYLAPKDSARWMELESEVLRLDSHMRNLRFSLGAAERDLFDAEVAVSASPDVRRELADLQAAQALDEEAWEALSQQLASLESAQEGARLNALRADQDRDAAYRDLERRQLLSIASVFPTRSETARYLLSKLFTDGECLTCGNEAPEAVARMRDWLERDRCVICGSSLVRAEQATSFSAKSIAKARTRFERTEGRRTTAFDERAAAEASFRRAVDQAQSLRAAMASRSARIDALVAQLPPDAAELHTAREELAVLRGRLELLRREVDQARARFGRFIRTISQRIAKRAEDVQNTFATFAEGFLLEDCFLAYQPHKAQVGQSGQQISFPAFDLDMTGATFESAVRRSGPEEVSESQREFIDLAFRMALITEAGEGSVGSLVIDAPESSLDAVFVERAADVLTKFALRGVANRLVITSNLVEGSLIPELIRHSGITSSRDSRVVDLLKLAAPTAAVRQLSSQYKRVRDDLFSRAGSSS